MKLQRNIRLLMLACAVGAASLLGACGTTAPPVASKPAPYLMTVEAAPEQLPPAVASSAADTTLAPLAPTDEVAPAASDWREFETGGASWYGPRFHGKKTASGERYDQKALTAAHRTLPFGTMVRVRSLVNGHEVDVRINDRGPFSRNRIIDVSRAAAEQLGMLGLGFKDVALSIPASAPEAQSSPPTPARKRTRSAKKPVSPRLR